GELHVSVEWTSSTHFFFFSSRRRHTRSKRDWSSDVCSSDLHPVVSLQVIPQRHSRPSLRDETLLRELEALGGAARLALGYHAVIDHPAASTKIMIHRLQGTST